MRLQCMSLCMYIPTVCSSTGGQWKHKLCNLALYQVGAVFSSFTKIIQTSLYKYVVPLYDS